MKKAMQHLEHSSRPEKLRAEQRFANKIRQALDESVVRLPSATLERLAMARKAALRIQKFSAPARVFAREPAFVNGGVSGDSRFTFGRASFVFSLLLLVGVCLTGLFQIEQQRRIEELADVDAAVLSDDLPISAYADHGFNAFLKQNQ